MRKEVLLELADKWERDNVGPDNEDGSEDAKIPNAFAKGRREAFRDCAKHLKLVIDLLGD